MSAADCALPAQETAALLSAAAEDLRLLARLHDRELDAGMLGELRRQPLREVLALEPTGAAAREALELLGRGLATLPDPVEPWVVDEFAADYAAIYVTHSAHAWTSESAWLTDEHIERQEPMFEVRQWDRHHGLQVADWRRRPDDHLVPQLSFVAHLLSTGRPEAAREAARFLDAHLLRWLDDFAEAVGRRARTLFYAGLARLTAACVQELRNLLELATGEPRRVPTAARPRAPCEAPATYVPGSAPGW